MWDTSHGGRGAGRVDRESEGKNSGLPPLAKNERDMGHPSFVTGREAEPRVLTTGPIGAAAGLPGLGQVAWARRASWAARPSCLGREWRAAWCLPCGA